MKKAYFFTALFLFPFPPLTKKIIYVMLKTMVFFKNYILGALPMKDIVLNKHAFHFEPFSYTLEEALAPHFGQMIFFYRNC